MMQIKMTAGCDNVSLAIMTAGCDNVSLAILKGSIQFIANPLACIISNSMRSGIFPDNLKITRIVPIFTSGHHKLFNNYRPISVL